MTHERYIVFGLGYWGAGEDIAEAKKQYRKAGGRLKNGFNVLRFTSELPFAPPDRDANDDEADCWVNDRGVTHWVRCERQDMGVTA